MWLKWVKIPENWTESGPQSRRELLQQVDTNRTRRGFLKGGVGIALGTVSGTTSAESKQSNKAKELWNILTDGNWGYQKTGLKKYHQETGHSGKKRDVLVIGTGFSTANPLFNPLYRDNEVKDYHVNIKSRFLNGHETIDDTSSSGHGTGVIGILWQATPNANFHVVKANGEDDVLQGLRYARKNKRKYDVVTISWGSTNPRGQGEALRKEANKIPDEQTLFIAASGNNTVYPEPPSTASKAICVASTQESGEISQGGSPSWRRKGKPDIAAPGEAVLTLNPSSSWTSKPPAKTGSSFAAPHVAGIALLLSKYGSAPDIKEALLKTAEDIPDEDIDGEGRVRMMNAYEAVTGGQSNTEEPSSNANGIVARFEENLETAGSIENTEAWDGDTHKLFTWEDALASESSYTLPTDTGWGGPEDFTSEYYESIGDNFLIQRGAHRETLSRFTFSEHPDQYPAAPFRPSAFTLRVGSNVFASNVEGGSELHLNDSEGNLFFAVTYGASGEFAVDYTEINNWDDELQNNGLFEIRVRDIDWENKSYRMEVYEQTETGYEDSPILSESDTFRTATNIDTVELQVGHDKAIYIDNVELKQLQGSQGGDDEAKEGEGGKLKRYDPSREQISVTPGTTILLEAVSPDLSQTDVTYSWSIDGEEQTGPYALYGQVPFEREGTALRQKFETAGQHTVKAEIYESYDKKNRIDTVQWVVEVTSGGNEPPMVERVTPTSNTVSFGRNDDEKTKFTLRAEDSTGLNKVIWWITQCDAVVDTTSLDGTSDTASLSFDVESRCPLRPLVVDEKGAMTWFDGWEFKERK